MLQTDKGREEASKVRRHYCQVKMPPAGPSLLARVSLNALPNNDDECESAAIHLSHLPVRACVGACVRACVRASQSQPVPLSATSRMRKRRGTEAFAASLITRRPARSPSLAYAALPLSVHCSHLSCPYYVSMHVHLCSAVRTVRPYTVHRSTFRRDIVASCSCIIVGNTPATSTEPCPTFTL